MKKPKKKQGNPHVRIYAYEMRLPAWQTLTVDAKALLVELRALYRLSAPAIVFLSVREGGRRLGIGQRRVQKAFADLTERGWISVVTPGGFNRKTRHATSYRLENEATGSPGCVPRKTYTTWSPPKNTVAVATADGSSNAYSAALRGTRNAADGSCHAYRHADIRPLTVATTATQVTVTTPRGCLSECQPRMLLTQAVAIRKLHTARVDCGHGSSALPRRGVP